MKRTALLVALITICACGGGGNAIPTPSPFAGTWAGTYATPSVAQNGTATITISIDGTVAGSGHNNTTGNNFTMAGAITNGGVVAGSLGGGLTGTLNGTLAIAGNGHLTGSIIQTVGAQSATSNFDLTKQ